MTNEEQKSECLLAGVPELNIKFRRFVSAKFARYVCAWRNENDSHVYEVAIRQFEGAWRASLMNDGNTVCELLSKSKELAKSCALAAMRRYLIRGHRRTWRKVRAAAEVP